MGTKVRRVYVEKKQPFAVKAKELLGEIEGFLGISGVTRVRQFIRYDVENLTREVFEEACRGIFAEPPVDILYREELPLEPGTRAFGVEYLPGQYDQRADSAMQCIRFLREEEEPLVRTAVTYAIEGEVTEEEWERIKSHCINPVDSRETGMDKPETLAEDYGEPEPVAVVEGFRDFDQAGLEACYHSLGLAMTLRDFLQIQEYFRREEGRDPSLTEIRVLDTYWSDHCRHTTFSTRLTEIEFQDGYYRTPMETAFQSYLDTREELFSDRPDKDVCLMDLATIAMRKLRREGKLQDMEESEEINACSIVAPVKVDYGDGPAEEEWLIFFKNETHNHPTEIEPFGGAATCLGGCIRDPLSGRGYVYQAMRVTGAADPRASLSETLEGKLPQKKLVRGAAAGYSSYGNQIGLATGYVKEIYHPGYVAKRMEIGAVMGAAPRRNVVRESGRPGDLVLLLGGPTGRDGCGGATGSSKAHTESSIKTCGAQVQKGNAPTERKLQRLFRKAKVSRLIKKCNDFGAGGVSVAIGELAHGLRIDLDKIPKKYAGLDGTELAISESQERMAAVIDPACLEEFLGYAKEENLEAAVVAEITKEGRLAMLWRGQEIVSLSRAFLDTNGARQSAKVRVGQPDRDRNYFHQWSVPEAGERLREGKLKEAWLALLSDLNVCSQKGLAEMFDSSVGAGSVLMPYGGITQKTEAQAMAARLPVLGGESDTVTMMSYGFDPYLSSWSPYHGAVYAVLESMARIVAAGGDYRGIRFTFQEYFGRMTGEPSRWGQPFAALLGAYDAQIGFGLPSIGGKDSMSGSFREIDVPPTLVSFAVDVAKEGQVITPELKQPGNKLIRFNIEKDEFSIPVYESVKELYACIHGLIQEGFILSAYALDAKGVAAALSKMAFGNGLGVALECGRSPGEFFENALGDILAEATPAGAERIGASEYAYSLIGTVTEEAAFVYGDMRLSLEEAEAAWAAPLEGVFPAKAGREQETMDGADRVDIPLYEAKNVYVCREKKARPTVFIPVFPGTNCEYDSARAFEREGARTITRVFKNLTAGDIRESVEAFAREIRQAQIVMFPGGFSAGDEPDGSAKFFATAFRNEKMKEAVQELLDKRDGLCLGICNGFQALIKLGLAPWGRIVGQDGASPTLTYNTISRHISRMVYTKVVSNKSPWLMGAQLGRTYVSPASHGEGRFVADEAWLDRLIEGGQVATQYADPWGRVTMDGEWNVNGSYGAIEGITSPDGRCLGKMAHVERQGRSVAINIYGEQDMGIFASGVRYFRE